MNPQQREELHLDPSNLRSSLAGRPQLGVVAGLPVALLVLALAAPVRVEAGGTPAAPSDQQNQLIMQEGGGQPTANGDFITAPSPGLNSNYSYFLEVPAGLSRLVIDLFDADWGGGAADATNDRDRPLGTGGSAGFESALTYQLFDPSGNPVDVQFSRSYLNFPSGADNAWLNLYDSNDPIRFEVARTAVNTTTASGATGFVGSNTTVKSASTTTPNELSITVPAGGHGDLLLAVVSTDGGTDGQLAPVADGWTELFVQETTFSPGVDDFIITLGVWYRFAGGQDPASYRFAWTESQEAAGAILRYSGIDFTTPVDAFGDTNNQFNTTPIAPAVTTTVANTRVLRLLGADGGDAGSAPATQRVYVNSNTVDTSSTTLATSDATQALAGGTGTAAFTYTTGNNEQWVASTVALRPDTTTTATPTSITLRTPTATAEDDLLIATVATDGNAPVATPAGWTLIDLGQSPGNASTFGVWYRVATASEPATHTFTWGAPNENATGTILRYTGVDTSTPIDVSGVATGNSVNPTAPSVTTTAANARLLRLFGADTTVSVNTVPTGTTRRYAQSSGGTGPTTSGGSDVNRPTAGATGTGAFTISAAQPWRAVSVALRPDLPTVANGHWELRVESSQAVTNGDDINAYGVRAHDGDSTSGGTEINVYTEDFYIIGVNNNDDQRDYQLYPYVTSGCDASFRNFDWDSNSNDTSPSHDAPFGSWTVTSRSGAFTAMNPAGAGGMSGNDVWQTVDFAGATGWTDDDTSADYGIWDFDVNIQDFGIANYGNFYFGASDAAATPPTDPPTGGVFRIYLPRDGAPVTPNASDFAPDKPYLEQHLTWVDQVGNGPNPPQVGQTTRFAVSVAVTHPEGAVDDITFSASDVVSATVPGGDVLYGGLFSVTSGSVISQPVVGGSGTITWNPGTVAPGSGGSDNTERMIYFIDVTPSGAGDVVATGTPSGGDGTTAEYVDETGDTTNARATNTLGPLCELTVSATNQTPVLVSDFAAAAAPGGVLLEWRTAAEAGTVAFDLYRLESGEPVQVNDHPLPALLDSPQGGEYRFLDRGADPEPGLSYLLVETESSGAVRLHGPYTPEIRWQGAEPAPTGGFANAPYPPTAEQLERLAQAANEQAAAAEGTGAGEVIEITVAEPGLHRVSASELAPLLGVDLRQAQGLIGRYRLSLTQGGEPVAWLVDGDGEGLLFYAQAVDSIYTSENVYRLERGEGVAMRKLPGSTPPPEWGLESFRDTVHAESDLRPVVLLPLDPESDVWFWDFVRNGDAQHGSKGFEIHLPAVAPAAGDAILTVHLQGGSPGEHGLSVAVNGTEVGEVGVDDLEAGSATLAVSHGLLAPGANTVQLTGVAGDLVFVDGFDLEYRRFYEAVDDRLVSRGDGNRIVAPGGFTASDVRIFDLSDPRRPAWLTAVRVIGQPLRGGYRAIFEPRDGDREYLAVSSAGIREPVSVTADAPSDLRSPGNAADYLVITVPHLRAAAEALASHRAGQGLDVMVVDLADVYDELNHGLAEPPAIRDFLAYAAASWAKAPRYVVLAGAGSYDYRDNLGLGGNLIPPLLRSRGDSLFATDVPFADFDGDGVPEMAIGRIPALTAGELQGYVDKVVAYEQLVEPEWGSELLMLADGADPVTDFAADSERLLGLVPAGYAATPIYLDVQPDLATARQLLFDGLDAGAAWLHYTGHGGVDRLSASGLLTSADVPGLANGDRLPVVTTLSCHIGFHGLPGTESLGELLVLHPTGGAAAAWAPAWLSEHSEARRLGDRLFRQLFQSGESVLGEAILGTLEEAAAGGAPGDLLETYQLLGDPALILQLAPFDLPGCTGDDCDSPG